jgi:hypothetical protein
MIVAYPGDETLWAGGSFLTNPSWNMVVVSMFQSNTPDRSESFSKALARLNASGDIVGLPDTTSDEKAPQTAISDAVLRAVEVHAPDLLITHNPLGECSRNCGRDVIGQVVAKMWELGRLKIPRLGFFAYDDNHGQRLPWAIDTADCYLCLSNEIWTQKKDILLNTYGFAPDSFVARACPKEEAFYWFNSPDALRAWRKETVAETLPPIRKGPPKKKRRVVA